MPDLFCDEVIYFLLHYEGIGGINKKRKAKLRKDGLIRDVGIKELLELNDETFVIAVLKVM